MSLRQRFSRSGRVQETPELSLPGGVNGGPAVRPRPASGPSSTPTHGRGLLRPLPLLGVLLALVAFGGYVSAYERAGRRTAVLVASRTLPAGTILEATDVRSVGIAASQSVLATLVARGSEATVVGRRLAATVPAGAPLPAGAFAASSGVPDSLTLSVLVQHAHGGDLAPGDRVTVLATFTSPNGAASTRVVGRDLEVLAVGVPPAGLDAASALIPVTVALPPSLARPLALANSEAKLDLLLQGTPHPPAPVAREGGS